MKAKSKIFSIIMAGKFFLPLLFLICGLSLADAHFLPKPIPKGQPVHRFWSEVFKHQFLTIDEAEKDFVISHDSNWRYDGIAYYTFKTKEAGTLPLYRFWSPVFKGHFFTINEDEKALTEKNPDWTYEGIAYYVYPENQAPGDSVPVYRLWSDVFKGHFFTTFEAERDSLAKSGKYRYEHVAFRAYPNPSINKIVGTMMSPFQDSWSHPPPYDDYKRAINEYHVKMGKYHKIVMFFSAWENNEGMYGFGRAYPDFGEKYEAGWLANQIYEAGATPMITWEPYKGGAGIFQEKYSLDRIINGTFDNYIRAYARDVRNWGKPILIRWAHEMNGDYYSWSCSLNGGDPGRYVKAFRHVRDLFRAEGAFNAYFVWSPNYASPPTVKKPCDNLDLLYPGDEYVDFIGVSAFNWGSDTSRGPGWVNIEALIDGFLNHMAKVHPNKEVIICETGTAHDRPLSSIAQWLYDTYNYIAKRGTVSAIVYFDDFAYHNPSFADFRVSTGHDWASYPLDPAITEAYKAAISNYK